MNEQKRRNLQEILEKILKADEADKGNIQLYQSSTGTLEIVAQIGFQKEFLEYFKNVKAFDSSACGRAFGIGNTILINDVTHDIGLVPHLRVIKAEGVRAVKSIPLISENQKYVGVISTHFPEPKWVWDTKRIVRFLPELIQELENYQTPE